MKNIIDLYNADSSLYEENATPTNTTGMGNPMPATEECNGSEPLTCKKKGKCKKQKVDEASILDIEGTLAEDGELLEFAQWFVNNQFDCLKILGNALSVDKDEVISGVLKTVKVEKRGTYVIDVEEMYDNCPNRFWNDRFYIPQSGVPKFIKHLKFTGCKYGGPFICCLTHDVSKLEISSYTDNGNSFGDVEFTFWSGIKKKDVKIGKLTCKNFKISYNKQIESLMIANGSTILQVDLSSTEELKQIYGKFLDASQLRLPRKLVNNVLADYGLISHGADIQYYG